MSRGTKSKLKIFEFDINYDPNPEDLLPLYDKFFELENDLIILMYIPNEGRIPKLSIALVSNGTSLVNDFCEIFPHAELEENTESDDEKAYLSLDGIHRDDFLSALASKFEIEVKIISSSEKSE